MSDNYEKDYRDSLQIMRLGSLQAVVEARAKELCTHERMALNPWPCSVCTTKAWKEVNDHPT